MRTADLDSSLGARPEFIETLSLAVHMWAHRWRARPVASQLARAHSLAPIVAAHGDAILYRTKGGPTRRIPAQKPDGGWQTVGRTHAPPPDVIRNPSSAEVFNALAEGIALLSLIAPGGADLFGRHWHDRCDAASRDDCVDLHTEGVDRGPSTVDRPR